MNQPRPEPAEQGTPPAREAFSLREWTRIATAHAWWIATITAAVLVATALTTLTATPYYRATQRILIERETDQVLRGVEVYDPASGNNDYYLTQYKLLESRAVAAAALELLPAADRGWFAHSGDPVAEFSRLCEVVPVRKSRLVDIRAEHPEPKVAEQMARALVDAYVADTRARRDQASRSALQRLRDEAVSLEAEMLTAQRAAQEFKRAHGLVSIDDRQSLAAAQLEALSRELAAIERDYSDSNARLETATRAMRTADFEADLPEVLQNTVVTQYKLTLLDASMQLSQLAKKYKERHPRVLEQRSRLQAVERRLGQEVRAIFGALQHENDRLDRHRKDIQARMERQTARLAELDGHRIQHQLLTDRADGKRKLFETVRARLAEAEVVEDYKSTDVHLVGPARATEAPVRPRPLVALLIALGLGLLLAGATAFALDWLDRSIKTGAEAEHLLGVPVVGLVPRVRGAVVDGKTVDERALEPGSAASEAFRSIRTALALSPERRDIRMIAVTSAAAGDGKSLCAINLAAAFARSGYRVLLVDAEMRRPRLHHAFGLEAVEGLSSVLVGERTADEVAYETGEPNLYLMPCGVVPPNPVELLTIGLSKSVRRQLLDRFDIVVLDTPPVGLVSDCCVVAPVADAVLFVVRTLATERGLAQRAVAALRSVGARVAGVVLNHADARAERTRQLAFGYDSAYAATPTPRAPAAAVPRAGAGARPPAPDQDVIVADTVLGHTRDELAEAVEELSSVAAGEGSGHE